MEFVMRLVVSISALCLLAASAYAGDIRSVTADSYGNAIIITQGGAKVIAVGQAELAENFVAENNVESGKNCREVGIVLKGRSFMYGIGDGDAVPLATKIMCN
jgi:hypothetical protein